MHTPPPLRTEKLWDGDRRSRLCSVVLHLSTGWCHQNSIIPLDQSDSSRHSLSCSSCFFCHLCHFARGFLSPYKQFTLSCRKDTTSPFSVQLTLYSVTVNYSMHICLCVVWLFREGWRMPLKSVSCFRLPLLAMLLPIPSAAFLSESRQMHLVNFPWTIKAQTLTSHRPLCKKEPESMSHYLRSVRFTSE